MQAQFLEPHARALYRLLNHGEHFSDCRCIDVNAKRLVDRTILKGEKDFIRWAREFNGKANCFVGRNPRAVDGSVFRVTSYSFDLDPIREPGTASSDLQLQDALLAGRDILRECPSGYLASSGNGTLVLYMLSDMVEEFKAFEQWLASREDALQSVLADKGRKVKVDHTHDSARIIKLVGTLSTKGDQSLWRVSRFFDLPGLPFKSVPVPDLAAWRPPKQPELPLNAAGRPSPIGGGGSSVGAEQAAQSVSVGQGREIAGSVEISRARVALSRLTQARCDGYDSWVRVGLALRQLGAVGLTLWEEWSRKSQRFQEGACEQKWATFDGISSPEKLTIASLIYWADQDDPRGRLERGCTISVADLSDQESTVAWLVPSLIARGSISFVSGLPKTMKTWLAMDLAIDVASGSATPWLGLFPVSKGRVLYIEQERPAQETTRRFLSLLRGKGMSRESLRDSLMLKLGTSIRVDLLPSFLALQTELMRLKPDLLVVDSFATFHTRDDANKSEAQVVLERVKEIRKTVGCAVLFVDHETKQVFQDERDNNEVDYGRMHGSVGKAAAAECILTVRRHDRATSAVYNTANTLAAPAERFYVRIKDVGNNGGIVLEGSR